MRRTRPRLLARSTKKPSGRPRHRLELELPAPGAQLGARPVEFGRRQVAGVELLDQQHVEVFLLGAPLHRARSRARESDRDTRDAELDGARIELVQIRPFGGNPALVPEHAQLRVGAVVMEQPREKQRDHRFPARIRAFGQRPFERRLVRVDEALAHLLRRLPAAVGDARGAVDVLDVLLDELAAVRAQGRVEELDGGDAIEVDRPARLAHAVEDAHDLVLAGDDVLGRQVPQPGGDGLVGTPADRRRPWSAESGSQTWSAASPFGSPRDRNLRRSGSGDFSAESSCAATRDCGCCNGADASFIAHFEGRGKNRPAWATIRCP